MNKSNATFLGSVVAGSLLVFVSFLVVLSSSDEQVDYTADKQECFYEGNKVTFEILNLEPVDEQSAQYTVSLEAYKNSSKAASVEFTVDNRDSFTITEELVASTAWVTGCDVVVTRK